MFKELPQVWQKKLQEEMDFVRKNGFFLTNPEEARNKPKSLSVLAIPNHDSIGEIHNFVVESIPENLKSKLYVQPPEGYHISLQWSREYSNCNMEKLIESTKKIFTNQPPITVDIMGLYPSDNNLFVIPVNPSLNIFETRTKLVTSFSECGAKPRLAPKLSTLWISVVRITKQLSESQIEQTITDLPKKVFPKISFNKVHITLNDSFFTPEVSEILTTINLKS